VSQVLFGSDYPYRPGLEAVEGLADYKFGDADARAIDRDNATKLLRNVKAG